MSPLDSYTIKARLAPALIVVLPLFAVTSAAFPQLLTVAGISWLGIAMLGVAALIAFQTRQRGRSLQDRLYAEWGGPPTTTLLRYSDPTLPQTEKQRYHALLQRAVPNVDMHPEDREWADRASAVRNIEIAVGWLREQTRNNPVVNGENTNYGFHRNLCALRTGGIVAAIVGVIGSSGLFAFEVVAGNMSWPAVVAFVVSVVSGLVMSLYARPEQVKAAAFLYAHALVRAIDGLPVRQS